MDNYNPIIEGEKGVGAVQICAHVSRVLLALCFRYALVICSRGSRGIPFLCLQPLCPYIGLVFLSGCFGGFWERVFLLFLGRGCFCFSPRGCFCCGGVFVDQIWYSWRRGSFCGMG